jgi:hypothetical protein
MKIISPDTHTVNKWWDNLPHNLKDSYIKQMNPFNWGYVISISAITKNQKNELYQQVHNLNGKKLSNQ